MSGVSGRSHDEIAAAFREAEQYADENHADSLNRDTAAYFYLAAILGVDVDKIREEVRG